MWTSYEPKTHSWGKVLFAPKKAEDQEKKAEKQKESAIPEKDKGTEKASTDQVRAPEKETAKTEQKKKWWGSPEHFERRGEADHQAMVY